MVYTNLHIWTGQLGGGSPGDEVTVGSGELGALPPISPSSEATEPPPDWPFAGERAQGDEQLVVSWRSHRRRTAVRAGRPGISDV
jgi:hypothetical protein